MSVWHLIYFACLLFAVNSNNQKVKNGKCLTNRCEVQLQIY